LQQVRLAKQSLPKNWAVRMLLFGPPVLSGGSPVFLVIAGSRHMRVTGPEPSMLISTGHVLAAIERHSSPLKCGGTAGV